MGRLVEIRGPVVSSTYGEEVTWQIAQVEQNEPWLIQEADGSITAEIATWDSRLLHPDSWLKPIRPEAEDDDEALWRELHAPKSEGQQAVVQADTDAEKVAHERVVAHLAEGAIDVARARQPQAISRSGQVLRRTAELWLA